MELLNNFWFLVLCIIIIETISLSILAKEAQKKTGLYIIGIIGYLLVGFLFLRVLKLKSMSKANAIWNILSIILVSIVGYFLFRETIDYIQGIGIILAIISILLIEHIEIRKFIKI